MENIKISVVVCVLNEEKRIENCLKSILKNNPDEIILVDGGSKDKTVEIAKKYTNNIICNEKSNLTRDRQCGINAASNSYVALIDADHRLKKDDIKRLMFDMKKYNFDIVQSQLCSYRNNNWMNKAEEQMWDLNHNIAGPRDMMGVAPAIYKKSLFEKINFDDTITKTIDDTDFIYRLSLIPEIKYGIGDTKISQLHTGTCKSYIKKFKWYGIGDGEFCIKHKNRRNSMIYHLFIRYPIIYFWNAIGKGKLYAAPYVALQGWVRGFWCLKTMLNNKIG